MILVASDRWIPPCGGIFWVRAALFSALALLSACGDRDMPALRLSGDTMGTSWHVTVVQGEAQVAPHSMDLQNRIQQALDEIEQDMSTYRPASDLSRFNRASAGETVAVSARTMTVTQAALRVAGETGNSFNPAVAELVSLWGFGAEPAGSGVPAQEAITAALQNSSLERLELDTKASALRKLGPMQLDFSAIAKGYAVDEIAGLLRRSGFKHYLVEIGGELKTSGFNAHKQAWRIGIESPQLVQGAVQTALAVSGEAVATSGDYRNYREVDGVRFSHTIDPVSGRPVRHKLVSVTVVTESAMLADAYATAITVMGPERGLVFASEKALPVYMLVKQDGAYVVRHSDAYAPYLQ